jgi:putative transposase
VVTVHQAYRFALDPTPSQTRDLRRHAGAARFAFNWGLALVKSIMEQRKAEATYGTPADELTPALSWTLAALRKRWNQAKPQAAPWWAECSKEAYNTGLDNLARALTNWSDSRQAKSKARKVGFPRFKAKRNAGLSCRFTTGAIRVEPDRHHITLPRLGTIKTHESTRKLARRIEADTARILSATVRFESGRWFCAFTCEVQRAQTVPTRPDIAVGIDLGIRHLAVMSQPIPGLTDADGFVANPRHLAHALRRLRRACRTTSRRRGPDRTDRRRPSKRWERANRQRNRVHDRVAALRRDGLHKLTTALVETAGVIVIEDLNVAGMLRNRTLARSIADAGFGEVRRQLSYKTLWRGSRLVVADRWYPSSKTCSACGAVKAKLPLRARTYICEHCGLVVDRDRNAACNLAAIASMTGKTGTGVAGHLEPIGSNGRGANCKTRSDLAGGREASTPHRAIGQDGDRPSATADATSSCGLTS